MKELNPAGCQTTIYGDSDIWGHQCRYTPTVTREGKVYCKIHDPEYIKAKRKAWDEKFNKEWLEKQARSDLYDAQSKATKGLTLEELRQVTPDLIREALARKP